MTIASDIQTVEKKVGVFVTSHHIVLYAVLAVALLFGVYAIESRIASVAEAKAEAAQQALAVEKDHSAQLVKQFEQNEQQRQKENQQFLQTISQLQSNAKIQIERDKQLPAPELGHRIEDLTGFKQNTIVLDSSDNLIVPLPLGREIVGKLDQAAADSLTIIQQNAIIQNLNSTIADQTKIIQSDKVVLAAQIDADKKELNAEKTKNRKSKLKWFGVGFVAGYIAHGFTRL